MQPQLSSLDYRNQDQQADLLNFKKRYIEKYSVYVVKELEISRFPY